jgi:hypothetical protein
MVEAHDPAALNDGLKAGKAFGDFALLVTGDPGDNWKWQITRLEAIKSRFEEEGWRFKLGGDIAIDDGKLRLAAFVAWAVQDPDGASAQRKDPAAGLAAINNVWPRWLRPKEPRVRELEPGELEQIKKPDFVKWFVVSAVDAYNRGPRAT